MPLAWRRKLSITAATSSSTATTCPWSRKSLSSARRFARGLLVMGPDCGTAIVGGTGLGFANRVRKGSVGLVGASGTGLQAVTSHLHYLGAGVSQAIGTGGRDLSSEVGGITAAQALDLLGRRSGDPGHRPDLQTSRARSGRPSAGGRAGDGQAGRRGLPRPRASAAAAGSDPFRRQPDRSRPSWRQVSPARGPSPLSPLPPPPTPLPGRGEPGWSVLAFSLLPGREVARGREKRAGVMRVLGGGALRLR